MDDPSVDPWEEAYDLMDRVRELAPWRWMADDEVFAVHVEEMGWTGYVSVFGAGGTSYGIFVFVGDVGLWTRQRQVELSERIERGERVDEAELLEYLPYGLSATFADRDDVSPAQRRRIRECGRAYRGRGAWPSLLRHDPGFAPDEPGEDELYLLCVTLLATLRTAERQREDREYVHPNGQMRLVTYGSDGDWRDGSCTPEPQPPPQAAPVDYADLLHRLGRQGQEPEGTWEVDFFYLQGLVSDGRGQRPFYPRAAIVVDASGLVVNAMVEAPGAFARQAGLRLFETFLLHGPPAVVRARHADAVAALQPLAQALGVKLNVASRLTAADRARRELLRHMGTMP